MIKRNAGKGSFRIIITGLLLAALFSMGSGSVWAANCGDTDYDGATDTTCACGDTVVGAAGYTYTLTGDLTCTDPNPGLGTDHGLTVGNSDITIDGDGHFIDGAGRSCVAGETNDAGVYMLNTNGTPVNSVTIENLEVKEFCHGIWLRTGGPGTSSDNTIQNCTIHDNGDGILGTTQAIKLNGIEDSLVTGCTIYNQNADPESSAPPGGFGIYLCYGDYNEFSYNTIYDNSKAGIFIRCSSMYGWVHNNYVHDNPFGGIRANCINSQGFTVEYNTCESNIGDESTGGITSGIGIYFGGYTDSPDNVARYNTCRWNYRGISFERNAYVGQVLENISCENEDYDIYVQDGAVVVGDDNTCSTTYNYNDYGELGCTYACNYPKAKFYTDSTTACSLGNVSFTDLSVADAGIGGCQIDSWAWDFGDGSAIDTSQNPVHQYTDSGIYDVSLTVTQSGGGCTGEDTQTRSAYIVVCPYNGDFDADTDVDGSDMAAFYTGCLQAATPPAWCDVNGDGNVNSDDMDNLGRSDCVSCP